MYLANGLFSKADRDFNLTVKEEFLAHGLDIFLPQENLSINDKEGQQKIDSVDIFREDNKKLDEASVLVAILDGVEIDSGVAAEIGRAVALGKPVVGIITDVRLFSEQGSEDIAESPALYRNLYVIGAIKSSGGGVVSSVKEGVELCLALVRK